MIHNVAQASLFLQRFHNLMLFLCILKNLQVQFFWKNNPIIALLFYIEFMRFFLAPVVFFSVFIYSPLILHQYWFILSYFLSDLILGTMAGIDYKFRNPKANNWKYKPIMNLVSSLVLSWVMIPALLTYRSNKWLTR